MVGRVFVGRIFLRAVLGWLRAARRYLSTARPLARLIWQASPPLCVASVVLTLVTGAVPTASIFATSSLLDLLVRGVRGADVGSSFLGDFVLLLAFLAGINLLGQVSQSLSQALNQLQGTRIANRVEMLLAEKATEVDLAVFENPEFHNQMQTATDEAPHRPQTILHELTGAGSTLITLVSLVAVLLLWQAWVVPILVVASLATLWVSTRFGSALVNLIDRRAETERQKRYLNMLFTSDQAVKEIRLFSLQGLLLGKFRTLLETTYAQDRQLTVRELTHSVPAGMVLGAVQVALIAFTAFQALQGAITVGQFNLYTQSVVQVGALLPGLMFAVGTLHESNLFAAGLFNLLAMRSQVEAPRPRSKDRLSEISRTPRIEFRNVSFAYPGSGHTVLEEVSFVIEPGEAVALVGENGAGKSTLVKLLAGLYVPTKGKIFLDEVDVDTLDRDHLRQYLSVIFQDYAIYHFTARENIGIGRVNDLDNFDRIQSASRRSGLDRIISKLPDSYDTVLGRFWNNGHELSGGQRQLVALARALLRDAPILMLDEPSAALDIYTEQRFFQRLLESRGVKQSPQTVVFISHRFTTVRRADRILVVKDGRLIEQGSHTQLVSQEGHYAEMFNLQAALYEGPRSTTEVNHKVKG